MDSRPPDYGLEFLLDFDGHIHHLEEGYRIKFEIKRVRASRERPRGLSYSFTLHAPDGSRLVGFDNAHGVPAAGSRFNRPPEANDHWHRTENDPGRPCVFESADALLGDFFGRSAGFCATVEFQDSARPWNFRDRRQSTDREEVTA